MMSEYLLEDLIIKIIDNRGKSPQYFNGKTEYPIIEVNSIRGDRIYPIEKKFKKFVTKEIYKNWFRNGHPEKDDLLISTVGSGNIGEVALYNNKGCLAQNVVAIRVDEKICDKKFIYYLFSSKKYKSLLVNLDIGTAQPSIKLPHILKLKIKIPKLEYQNYISNVLYNLDKKIELNLKMNENLKEISREIFETWFVNFDPVRLKMEKKNTGLPKQISDLFPNSFQDSELGKTPKGWVVSNFSELMKIQGGFAFKSKDFGNDGFSVVKIKNILVDGGVNIVNCEKIKNVSSNLDSFILNDGDTIIAMTGATVGKVGLVSINNEKVYLNQRVGRLRPLKTKGQCWYSVLLLNSDITRKKIKLIASGSAQPNISSKDIESIKTINPPTELLKIFNNLVSPIFSKILLNLKENKNLIEVKNILIKDLVNGKLKINNLKKKKIEN